jgi:hypothetical protein
MREREEIGAGSVGREVCSKMSSLVLNNRLTSPCYNGQR